MREAGYISGSQNSFQVGENIAWGTLWLGTPRSIVAAWMASRVVAPAARVGGRA
jgi:hypothetical protein